MKRIHAFSAQLRQEVVDVLSKIPGKDISHDDFRIRVEELYNFRVDPGSLSQHELKALDELFALVTWYSPFPEEREEIPHYKNEEEVENAARKARRVFGLLDAEREK